MHPRNKHKNGYQLSALTHTLPELKKHLYTTVKGEQSVNFSDPLAVKCLNKALLMHHYKVQYWDLPAGYLCPPIPSRADYIHHLADLLSQDNSHAIPTGKNVRVLDIGTGANLVYPLIATSEYNWRVVGADIDPTAIKLAQHLATANKRAIEVKQQPDKQAYFKNIIQPDVFFHLTLCNPPFHASAQDAQVGSTRKWRNLKQSKAVNHLNFGGQHNELWCDGGEKQFISSMIKESQHFAEQVLWFSCLVSKKDTLPALKKLLAQLPVKNWHITTMQHGQKASRFIVWSYFTDLQRGDILIELP